MEENVCQQSNQTKGLISKIYNSSWSYQKHNPIKKQSESKQTFLQRRYTDGQRLITADY